MLAGWWWQDDEPRRQLQRRRGNKKGNRIVARCSVSHGLPHLPLFLATCEFQLFSPPHSSKAAAAAVEVLGMELGGKTSLPAHKKLCAKYRLCGKHCLNILYALVMVGFIHRGTLKELLPATSLSRKEEPLPCEEWTRRRRDECSGNTCTARIARRKS